MKLTTISQTLKRGFTLVEILVVIAIIAGLASIATPIAMKMMENGRDTQTSAMMTDILIAASGYEADHGYISSTVLAGGAASTDGGGYTLANANIFDGTVANGTGTNNVNLFINQLANGTGAVNKKQIEYLKMPEASADRNFKGGLIYSGSAAVGIADPWGRRLFIGVDYNRDSLFTGTTGNFSPYGTNVVRLGSSLLAICSGGRDGLFNDERDVKSWE